MTVDAEALVWPFDSPVSSRFPVFTRANVSEVMPNVLTPLNWTLVGLRATEEGWREGWVQVGAFDHEEFSPEHAEAHVLFGGYLYINLSMLRVFGVRTPGMTAEMMDASLLGSYPDVPPHVPSAGDERPANSERIAGFIGGVFALQGMPELDEDARWVDEIRATRPDMTTLTGPELVAYMRTSAEQATPLLVRHIVTSMSGSVAFGVVTAVCEQVLGDSGKSLDLISALGGVVSADMALDLWALGRTVAASPALMAEFDRGVPGLLDRLAAVGGHDEFLTMFREVLHKHEFRGVDEFSISAPTWGLRPELPLAAVERMRFADDADAPDARSARLAAERERLTAEVLERLAGADEVRGQFQAALNGAQLLMRARERSKTTMLVPLYEVRLAALELGARAVTAGHFDQADDVFYLADDELEAFLDRPGDFTVLVAERRALLDQLAARRPPHIIAGEVPPPSTWPLREDVAPVPVATAGDTLQGLAGCPGQATGIARVVLDPADPGALEPGDILVAPFTDPAWTPLFLSASAVVVEHGAPVSHAVIISRELGIPCVASCTDATRRIVSGTRITVDGSTGIVTVLDR